MFIMAPCLEQPHACGEGRSADLERLRQQLVAAEAEAARLRRELEQAEWLADYDQAPEAR